MSIEYTKDPAGLRYVDAADISTRLNGSIVMYKGSPALVSTNLGADYKTLVLTTPTGTNLGTVSVTSPDIEQYDFPLGWNNSIRHGMAIHTARIPTRRYKQGLTTENTRCSYVDYGVRRTIDRDSRTLFENLGEFKNFSKKERDDWLSGSRAVALSRDVALVPANKKIHIYLGLDRVGEYTLADNSVSVDIPGIFSVISETLMEAGL